MPTFLTTSKMDPALAARIEASITGRKATPEEGLRSGAKVVRRSAATTRRLVSIARLVLVVTIVFCTYSLLAFRRESERALVQARASLLETVRVQGESLTPEDLTAVSRAEAWLVRLTGPYEGDHVAPDLRAPGKLAETLSRPLVYVRGTTDELSRPETIGASAGASTKDALVLCLLDPPSSRAETAVLDKVRIAYAGGWNLESRTPNVRRLNDAIVGLPFLQPAWAERVRGAGDAKQVARLRTDFERAPIDRAKQAATSNLLLAAIDEPGNGAGPTELDGERVHPVRVVLVDLASSEVLLRSRHVVDPSWITAARKATYAIGFDSCALALDVRADVEHAANGAPAAR